MKNLRVIAKDADDAPLIASAIQDAILRVGGLHYDPMGRYFSLRLSRYMHEAKKPARIESGLRIDDVLSVQSHGLDRANPDAFAVVLNVEFEAGAAPGGTLILTLAGGGAIKLSVEAVEMILADTGKPRPTKFIPSHDG